MKREDLRGRIIPTIIENTDNFQEMGNKRFNTKDLIYLDSYDEGEITSATDYAKMNNVYTYDCETCTGREAASHWFRYGFNGNWIDLRGYGVRPSLHYSLSSNIFTRNILRFLKGRRTREKREESKFDIKEVKDIMGKTIYHTLQIGEYPKTKVDESLSKTLELLYNGGKIKEGISSTGRWYSCNGAIDLGEQVYEGKHSPEFEYQGNRYVRVISSPNWSLREYSDGTPPGKSGTIRWVKVEPISFVIKNWNEMPKSINPKGTGKAKYFDLRAEEVITANIPFYPSKRDPNCAMWQNSCVRGFLNGIDVRNITQNGVKEYGAERGGNFTGECNFLNEAFNLSRQPMIEYTIPDSEPKIPDDAFNGCISLKKLVLHSGIKDIGIRAFDGLDFKYAYRTETGELIFSQELPKNKDEYTDAIELGKITKTFVGFDYRILLQMDRLDEIASLSENLSKNKFSMPILYGVALAESGKIESFCQNSDFRFFKNEFPNINNLLLFFSEEEKLDFFKFATALGCFSTEKILDKKGKETQVLLAQKASSLLAQLLKKEEMKLR